MNLSTWEGLAALAASLVVVSGALTQGTQWLRKRLRRSEPQAWVIEHEPPRAQIRVIDLDDDRGWHNIG